MKKISIPLIFSVALSFTALGSATAAPQTGTWLIANGEHAYGGDVINIDAQDNKVFIIFAAGEVPNNTYFWYGHGDLDKDNISVALRSSKDGSTINVSGTFDSSVSGTLDFPGVGKRYVYRVKHQDESKPESMFGLWNFSYTSLSTGIGVARARMFTSVIAGTASSAGMAVDSTGTFGCQFQVSGAAAGYTVCVDATDATGNTGFFLRRSADEAGGIYFKGSSYNNVAIVKRLVTSDSKTAVFLKEGSVSESKISYAIQNLVNNYGALASDVLAKQK